MSTPQITFEFEGTTYRVSGTAYDSGLDLIALPDGRILAVTNGWSETNPPTPLGLQVLDIPMAEPIA